MPSSVGSNDWRCVARRVDACAACSAPGSRQDRSLTAISTDCKICIEEGEYLKRKRTSHASESVAYAKDCVGAGARAAGVSCDL